MKKWEKTVLICALLLLPMMFLFGKIIFINSGVACAKPLYEDKTKGSTYIYFSYNVDDEIYYSYASIQFFRIRNFDSLKKMECFEIEYSKIFPSYTLIIDKGVGDR